MQDVQHFLVFLPETKGPVSPLDGPCSPLLSPRQPPLGPRIQHCVLYTFRLLGTQSAWLVLLFSALPPTRHQLAPPQRVSGMLL